MEYLVLKKEFDKHIIADFVLSQILIFLMSIIAHV